MQGSGNHRFAVILIALLGLFQSLCAQDVDVVLSTRQNRVEVGRPFRIDFQVQHPPDLVVIFPDSLMDFAPFELFSRRPLPTTTDENTTTSACVYELYTWQIDSIQVLQFPVRYIDRDGDTITVLSNTVEVSFAQKIAKYSDSLNVAFHPELAPIAEPVDWQFISILLIALVVLLGAATYFLWHPIRKAILRWRLDREWKKYLARLEAIRGLSRKQEDFVSELNKVWKRYFDRNRQWALTSMTTPELRQVLPAMEKVNESDLESLLTLSGTVDRILYAGQSLPEPDLLRLHGDVSRIMESEYLRRKKVAEA